MTLTIGQLGHQTGLSAKTIRFYEDIGLIAKAKRADNGYRVYEDDAKEELTLIKNARDLGLPIPEIRKLMAGCENGDCDHAKDYVEKEVASYLDILNEKIQQMQRLKTKLETLKKTIHEQPEKFEEVYCCNILNQITKLEGGEE